MTSACPLTGQAGCVVLLLGNGAAIEATDASGSTALIRAADQGSVKCVDVLVAKGSVIT